MINRISLVTRFFLVILSLARVCVSEVSYSQQVAPIMAMHCNSCHGRGDEWWPGDALAGELETRRYEGLMKGGASGKAIVPGKPEESLLVKMIEGTIPNRTRMPFEGESLSKKQIKLIRRWISEGAKEDADTTKNDVIEIPDIRVEPPVDLARSHPAYVTPLSVFCRVQSSAYLVLTVTQGDQVLETRTGTVKPGGDFGDAGRPGNWVRWLIFPKLGWPDHVTVTLAIAYAEDSTKAVFAVKRGHSSESGQGDGALPLFAPDPARPPVQASISYMLEADSNITVEILPVGARAPIRSMVENDLGSGLNKQIWDLKRQDGAWAGRGKYYARFRCTAKDRGMDQYDFVVTFGIDG